MDDNRMSVDSHNLLYLAISRYSGLWQVAFLWPNFPVLSAAYVIDEKKQEK